MRKCMIGLTTLFALVVATPVNATFYSGNELMHLCRNTKPGECGQNMAHYNACVGFLTGLNDAQETLVFWKRMSELGFYIPVGISQEQLRQVFLKFMDQHPTTSEMQAGSLALNAFERGWPCKE